MHAEINQSGWQASFEQWVNSESSDCASSMDKGIQTETQSLILDAEELDLSRLSELRRNKLAFSLGQSERAAVDRDLQNATVAYKNIEYLKEMNIDTHHQQQNPTIKAFLTGLRG